MNASYGKSNSHVKSNSRRRAARCAVFTLLASVAAVSANAQTPPYLEYQYATITGSGNTITVTRLPVVLSTGTSYVNVVIEFDVAANGTITVAGNPTVVAAPAQLINNFLAGSYKGPSVDSNYDITVFGPGTTTGGATEWSLATATGANCYTTPSSATWYVFGGPMTKHPLYQTLKAAGITTATYQAYSWGTTGTQSCGGSPWASNSLIGLSQTGSALMIYSFTSNGTDQNQPAGEITYVNQNP